MPLSVGGFVPGDADRAAVLAAETALLDPAVRADPARVGPLLADGFTEVGASGWWHKGSVLQALAGDPGDPAVEQEMAVHDVRLLGGGDVAVLTYRLVRRGGRGPAEQTSERCSVLARTAEGRWQLVHHHATVLAGESGSGRSGPAGDPRPA